MSLLEDVFLEDEANEANELERIIEGGEYEERIRSDSDDNTEKEDEAEEDKRRVDPTAIKNKRIVKNPRFTLNPARLTGPRGIQVIPEHFKDFKFKGRGHEKEDLDLVLKRLEHWAYRLYPKFKFEDCLKKIETLGKKRPVMVHLQKIRSDQILSEETIVQKDSSDEDAPQEEDEFDKLLQQQIDLARATPAPPSVKKNLDISQVENRSLSMPKATSSPSISDEQRERMIRNRKLAEERRLARLKAMNPSNSIGNQSDVEENNMSRAKKHSKLNVIDSSDEENFGKNETVAVHIEKHVDNYGTNVSDPFDKLISATEQENEELLTINKESDLIVNLNEEDNRTDKNDVVLSGSDKTSNIQDKMNEVVKNNEMNVVLESNIIQSTIQGLFENDNNINLERDLSNQEFVEDVIERDTEGNDDNNENVNEVTENVMDLDFNEQF